MEAFLSISKPLLSISSVKILRINMFNRLINLPIDYLVIAKRYALRGREWKERLDKIRFIET